MNLGSRVGSAFRWTAAAKFAAQLISWVGTLFVMRLLAPSDYGLAAISSAVLSIVSMIAEFGFGSALVQSRTLTRDQIRSVFGAALLFALASMGVVAALAPFLAAFFRAPEAQLLIQVASVNLLLYALTTVPDAMLRREMQFRGSSLAELAAGVLATVATVLMASFGYGVWALVLGSVCGSVLRIVLLYAIVPDRVWPSFRIGEARSLVNFGRNVALARIASYVFSQADVLLAGRILSKTALGEYAVAMHLAMLPLSRVMGIITQVAFPAISQLHRSKRDIRPELLDGLRLTAYVVIPALWGIAGIAPWFVNVALGPHWSNAALPLQIVCAVLPLRLIGTLTSTAVQGVGRPDIDLKNALTGVAVLPPCFLVGGAFGTTGLACGWLVGLPVLMGINIHRTQSVLGISILDALKAIARPAACSALMFLTVRLVAAALHEAANTAAGLGLMIAVGAGVYAACVRVIDRAAIVSIWGVLRPGRMRQEVPSA